LRGDDTVTDEQNVYASWDWVMKCRDKWSDAAEKLTKQNGGEWISGKELAESYRRYFVELTGILPFSPCPVCGAKLVPKSSKYGYFVGCRAFPECRFKAVKK
jgi:hypothetical protein